MTLFIGSRDSDMDILGTVVTLPSIDACFVFFLRGGRRRRSDFIEKVATKLMPGGNRSQGGKCPKQSRGLEVETKHGALVGTLVTYC